MISHLDVVAANGVPFRVVLLPAGEHNITFKIRSTIVPIVEFYDRRHAGPRFTDDGQLVSYYEVESLRDGDGGLSLYGGESSWAIDAQTMFLVREWLASHPSAAVS